MVKQERALDDIFAALSSTVRRQTLDALAGGARSASDLAAPHGMSLAGFMKHLRVLCDAGLLSCTKQGRIVTCSLERRQLTKASRWLARREQQWNDRLDALGRHLYQREQIGATATPVRKKGVFR